MDFDLTPEQELLRRTARDVLAECASMERVRRMIAEPDGLGERDWRRMAELGWQGLAIPEEYGGSGLGMLDLALVLEEMGRVVLPGPFLSTVLAGLTILACGDSTQRARWLPRIADGTLRATVAMVEESGRWDPDAVAALLEGEADGLVLSGTKRFVPDADDAGLVVCVARHGRGGPPTLVLVERGAPGLTVTPLTSMDQTRRIATLTCDRVRVAADQVLSDGGASALVRLLDRGRIALAADMCGGAERVLELTVEYAKVRQQFGRAIGSFQAIQHHCANMAVEVEKARAATHYAAWADDQDADDAAFAAATAKAITGDAYRFVTAQAIQVHGGIGFTWEHDLHLYFKRAQSGEMAFGGAAWNRELAARRLGL